MMGAVLHLSISFGVDSVMPGRALRAYFVSKHMHCIFCNHGISAWIGSPMSTHRGRRGAKDLLRLLQDHGGGGDARLAPAQPAVTRLRRRRTERHVEQDLEDPSQGTELLTISDMAPCPTHAHGVPASLVSPRLRQKLATTSRNQERQALPIALRREPSCSSSTCSGRR